MKKLLGIIVLSLLLSGNGFAEEEPIYLKCETKYGNTIFIKFHKTAYIYPDPKKDKLQKRTVKLYGFTYRGVVPTIVYSDEVEKLDKGLWERPKSFTIYESEKYYVFYGEQNNTFWFGGDIDIKANLFLINRNTLDLVFKQEDKLMSLGSKYVWNDDLVKGEFKAYNLLDKVHKCDEIDIKPKI
jgi:hypothetical protein